MIFCTVGTGSFDQLVAAVIDLEMENLVIQAGSFDLISYPSKKTTRVFNYCTNVEFVNYCDSAELIITHAGAGTVFESLEKSKKLIVVPNLVRLDQHQKELGLYLEEHNLALVCWDIGQLSQLITSSKAAKLNSYEKIGFYGMRDVLDVLL